MNKISTKIVLLMLFLSAILISTNLLAKDDYKSILKIKETNINGKILFEDTMNINYSNQSINQNIKYKNIIEKIIIEIKKTESEFKDDEIFKVITVKDKNLRNWTTTIRVVKNDESITHFISDENNSIIEGWINRSNKDFLGLRIFNF